MTAPVPRSSAASVEAVARAIAQNGFGRPWDDFLPINAHDTDQSDLIEYAQAALDAGSADGCFDMLWQWFTERRGADDMRANAADGGLSADDFKQMLDEHELNIMPPQPGDPAQAGKVTPGAIERMVTDAMDTARLEAIEECARFLKDSYPDHAAINAYCAAVRSLSLPSTKSGGAA